MEKIENITILFCEGPHDTAFLYRILKTKCYDVYSGTLSELPKIVGQFIESKNKSVEYDKLKIHSLKNEFIPYRIMYKKNRLILIYSLGGDKDNTDDKENKRLLILKHYFNDIPSYIGDKGNHGKSFSSVVFDGESYKYNFLFFYDADKDRQEKIKIVNKYIEKMQLTIKLEHNNVHKEAEYSLGLYIFSDYDQRGALENILYSIMKIDNEQIFEEAEKYYKNYFDHARTKKLVTRYNEDKIYDVREGRDEIDEKKSVIAIAGQLQKKGKSNVVVIEDTDYLCFEKIRDNPELQTIASFIENSAI